ncbi:MAG: thiol-disulfide oxidoreductase DCC family protein [Parvibaculales bacterium]
MSAPLLEVFYNGDCSICGPEIEAYKKLAMRHNIKTLTFTPIGSGLLPDGYARDTLLARLHVRVQGGEMLVGVAAFIALWRQLPYFVWLARALDWVPMRPLAGLVYDRMLAPFLYQRFLRRRI